jgi:hypothetical protein
MITYNLNTEDVSNLIKAHLCDDLMITNMEDYSVISSDSDKLYGYVIAFTTGQPVITKEDYKDILTGASDSESTHYS